MCASRVRGLGVLASGRVGSGATPRQSNSAEAAAGLTLVLRPVDDFAVEQMDPALGGSRVHKGAIWGKQIENPGYKVLLLRGGITRTRRSMMKSTRCICRTVAVLVVLVGTTAMVSAQGARTGDRPVPETFTATTTNMEPAGESLRFSVLRWSSEEDRHEVLSILTSEETQNEEAESAEPQALQELPSVGHLWLGSSGVGYSLKYAYRLATPDGGERITFITGRSLGSFAREPWRAVDEPNPPVTGYTVIELRLDADGNGEGKMSLAADVVFDTEAGTVALDSYETTPVLLEAVTREPPPYGA